MGDDLSHKGCAYIVWQIAKKLTLEIFVAHAPPSIIIANMELNGAARRFVAYLCAVANMGVG